jgi:TRAP-type C4-dicarboxylate transport system substrate-binding protein
MAACATAPTPAQTAVLSPTRTQAKAIELRFADWNPPESVVGQLNQKMADMICERSGGRLRIKIYPAESLANMSEVATAIRTGVADMAYWAILTQGVETELSSVVSLPFMGFASMQQATYVAQKLYDTIPEVQKEWEGMKVLGFRAMPGLQGQFIQKSVIAPDDMKGMKVIVAGQQWSEFIASIGAIPLPLSLGIGDWYLSLERGLAGGQFVHFPVSYIFKTLDLYKYYTMFGDFGCGTGIDCYLFNIDTWNNLPPDIQKIVREVVDWRTQEIIRLDIQEEQRAIDYAKSKHGDFTYLTPEQIKVWQDMAVPVIQGWIKEQEGKGLPAQKVYDAAKSLMESYSGK